MGANNTIAPEARSGLEAWKDADLPVPPSPKGLGWIGVVGPGVIVLGAAIGGGEFLLGPATFVKHGFSLLWVTLAAVFLQTIFNTELMRYTLATGEPAFTGFMRTKPSSTFWAWFYSLIYLLQMGWPAWAANAAAAAFFLFTRRLPGPVDAGAVFQIGAALYFVCVLILLFGRRIEHTLEILNKVLVASILTGFLLLAIAFVPLSNWLAAAVGYSGYDLAAGSFDFLPEGADMFLLAALAGYSGAGGVGNIVLTNWARDRGYGMGARAGFIPAAVGGEKVALAHTGFMFTPSAGEMPKWRGWWRVVRADQWGVFFAGSMLGMALPAMLYVTFLPRGADIRGLGISAALANAMGAEAGPLIAGILAFIGVWLLFKSQLDILEGTVRAMTDILWTGSKRLRASQDVRVIYYAVLAVAVVWGMVALRLAPPIVLLQIGANVASAVFVIASLHVLYINMRLLPVEVRPPMWRRVCLVGMTLFYSFFVYLSVRSFI